MWRPDRDFVPPFSQGLHFGIVCYPFCYLSIPVGLDSSVPILSSLDAFAGPFSNRSFLADPLSASQNKEFVLSLLILEFLPRGEELVNQEFLPRAEELMNRAPKHRRGQSKWIRLRS